MRHPVWILNSSLLIIFLTALTFVVLLREKTPQWKSIKPTPYIEKDKKDITAIAVEKIYNKDLFNTYHEPVKKPEQQSFVIPLPAPPQPQPVRITPTAPPKFLEPLQIALRGCIITGEDHHNRAIIVNNRTAQESSFKIGDKIDDASLVRIFRNRVLLVRANGQEETLYLREEDAKIGPGYNSSDLWEGIIKKVKDSTFIIEPHAFSEAIPSLAALIDNLDLTTVYKKGRSSGVRIGKVLPGSLSKELELAQGDIILSANGIPITTNKNRLKIYQMVVSLPQGETIAIAGNRNNTEFYRTIILSAIGKPFVTAFDKEGAIPRMHQPEKSLKQIEEEKTELLKQRQALAPTLDTIRKREKKGILEHIKKVERERKATGPSISLDI